MKMNLSNFKKVSEGPTHAVLMHPMGHQIKISKSSLSNPLKKQLSSLPLHKAEGGDVDSESDQSVGELMGDNGPQEQVPQEQAADVAQSQPSNIDLSQNVPAQRTPAMATAGINTIKQMQQGFGQEAQGIKAAGEAQAQQGQAEAQAAQAHLDQSKQLLQDYQQQHASLNADIQNAIQDVKNGHIDPNHYVNSKSDAGKVSTAIGLILGGMGGGLTHQGNPALQFLNAQIDRDVQAQQANMNQKNNILSAYFKQSGNLNEAMAMTKAFYTDLYSTQLQQAAAQSKSPLAQANAQQALGQLQIQKAQTLQPIALKNAALSQVRQGGGMGGGNVDPASLVPFLVPESHQKDVFKEIQDAQNTKQNMNSLLQNFDKAASENTILRTGAGLVRTPPSILSMRAMMLPIIHDKEGRVNEFEQKTTSDLEPKPGDTDAKIAAKRAALIDFLHGKMAGSTAKGFNLDLSQFPSTSLTARPPVRGALSGYKGQ